MAHLEGHALHVARYGPDGPAVVVLHGGPGARGSVADLAEALADPLQVLEPWQRANSDVPQTVALHVEDLARLIECELPGEAPAIVGHSWGAMLGLAFAAAHPARVSALALVGCGTFDMDARMQLVRTLGERDTPELRAETARIEASVADERERTAQLHLARDPLYTYARAAPDSPTQLDAQGQVESWDDMVHLQESGVYPAAFARISAPVLMLHGSYDPHPGEAIRDSLLPFVPKLEYQAFERCGHTPWIERHAREAFLERLRTWLREHVA